MLGVHMGMSHIEMIEKTFTELGGSLTTNQVYNYINNRWFRIAPTKSQVTNLLTSKAQFISVETTGVANSKGEFFQANVWEFIP